VDVRYYDGRPHFTEASGLWLKQVMPNDIVVAIHYFGFPNRTLPAAELVSRGATIIEDASQGFFVEPHYPETSFIVYSPRKFFGVPDGGVLISLKKRDYTTFALSAPPTQWFERALAVPQMRKDFDRCGGNNKWFDLFQEVEATFPLGLFRCSDLTRATLETGIGYENVKVIRRSNYEVLTKRLSEFALFAELDGSTVPLGFPVFVEANRRDAVLEALFRQQIYPPVHWRLEGSVPDEYSESHQLSQRIMTLICDQRYGPADMERQADAFLTALN